jgi:hypothetical protein
MEPMQHVHNVEVQILGAMRPFGRSRNGRDWVLKMNVRCNQEDLNWIQLGHNRIQYIAVVNMVMNPRVN